MLVFIPLTEKDLGELVAGRDLGARKAIAVRPERRGETDADAQEEAEYEALQIASLAALIAGHRRLVAVADLSARGHDAMGVVEVDAVPVKAITAYFTDEYSTSETIIQARAEAEACGFDLAASYEMPGVRTMMEVNDLLWYGPTEAADLVEKAN